MCIQSHDIQQGEQLSPALGLQQLNGVIHAWGSGAGKLPYRKGPQNAAQRLAKYKPELCPGGEEGQ